MRRLGSPTLEIIVVFFVVFALQSVGNLVGIPAGWFALAAPLDRPWSVVTSVYAHGSLEHLVVNAVALLLVGLPLERFASWFRYHAFFLLTGTIAGLIQITLAGMIGQVTPVLGASGAILALYGYIISGNPLTGGLLARFSPSRRTKLLILGLAAAAVVVLTAAPGVALIAHGAGFALGLLAGRFRLLSDRILA